MAAGVNYNNVWAALGKPVDVIAARQKAGEKENFHIGGSDASGNRLGGRRGSRQRARRRSRGRALWYVGCDGSMDHRRRRSDHRAERADLGIRDELGQLCAIHARPGASAAAEVTGPDLGCGSSVHAGRRHGIPDALLLASAHRSRERCGACLGRFGRTGITGDPDRAGEGRDRRCGDVGPERGRYCMDLGARGFIDRREFSHWGVMPDWRDDDGVCGVDRRCPRVRQGALDRAR